MGQAWSVFSKKPGPSGFGPNSTAEFVTANIDLHSKTAMVTGATSGIGKETARVLAKRGAHVIMAVRNTKAGEEIKLKFLEEDPSATLDVMQLDLGSLASVRKFAGDFRAQNLPLNILINNAGAVLPEFELSEDGMEKTFATNHIGPFLLTNLLLDTMKKTAKETGEEGRIVMVASHAHALASKGIPYDSLNDKKRYSSGSAYGITKLANILHANELSRRLQEEGTNVTANSVHPGVVSASNFGKTLGSDNLFKIVFLTASRPFMERTIPQGTATQCYVATSPNLKGVSGKYFTDCNEVPVLTKVAQDPKAAEALWKFSEDFVSAH
ncbi:unnamed protein product [Sphagnum compactum]